MSALIAIILIVFIVVLILGDYLRKDFKRNMKELQRIIEEDDHENK